MKVVETQDLASLQGTHQFVSLDFHIKKAVENSCMTLLQYIKLLKNNKLSLNSTSCRKINSIWDRMHISYKFGLAFGLLLALILFIAITGYASLRYVSHAEKSIQLSNEIKRLALEMDRGMERARWLHGRFFLEYPKIGFQSAHEKYIQPLIKEIQEVIDRSSLLKKVLSLSELNKWKNGHMDVTIEKSQIDLNIYLSSAKRFAETSLESVTLVSSLALPEKGLEARLDRSFDLLISEMDRDDAYSLMNGEREDLGHLSFQMNIMALKYRVSRQRFLMQSAFNVAFALKHAIYNSTSMDEFKRDKLLYTIEQWVRVSEEILTVDAAIKGKFNDFTIQANALDPISSTLMKLAEQEVSQARGGIKDAYLLATCIIILVTVTAISFAIMIFKMLNVSITKRIIALTDTTAKFRQNHLEFSCQTADRPPQNREESNENEEISIDGKSMFNEDLYQLSESGYCSLSTDKYGSDELGELSRTFDLMAIRMDALLNNLEEKVAQRTSELAESQKRLQRAEKMEAVGVLAGGVAHDLNNILSAVIGYPEILLMSLPSGSDLEKPLKAIRDSGQKAAAVVADLLTLARGAASSRGRENINSLIEQYMDSPEFHKLQESQTSVTYHLQLDPRLHNICCSGIHIRKTIMNLVINASEAIHNGGSITISTRNQYLDKDGAMQRGVGEGIYVVLNITDSGEGIQEEDIKNIFEPFYTRKVMGKSGTGLGLTVVWNTVQDHSGCITVTSNRSGTLCAVSSSPDGKLSFCKDGGYYTQASLHGERFIGEHFISDNSNRRGTSFELYFPAINDETLQGMVEVADGATGHADSPHLLKGHGEKIFVVDDEPDQIDLATRMLTILNYDAAGAESGEKAIEYLTQNQVDLLLLDMIMAPGMNGRETYEQLTKIYPSQKAIIVSGFSESVDVKTALKAGVISYLKKPYSIEELARSVADALKL